METFVSVDCECGGPSPEYNLCSIGACEVGNTSNGFYIELQPINPGLFNAEALAVGGFSINSMLENGTYPKLAMLQFRDWLSQFHRPKMVGFNAPFDWQFINFYFCRFLTENPLGINCIDIKSVYMGYSGCEWRKTTKSGIPARFFGKTKHTHNALDDAIGQAELFENLIKEIRSR